MGGVLSAVGVGGASAVRVGLWVGVNVGRVGNLSGVKVGEGATVSVGLTGVISARRCGPAQDTNPAPSAARTPFWRNFLLVSFPFMVMASYFGRYFPACSGGGFSKIIALQASPTCRQFEKSPTHGYYAAVLDS